MGAETGSDRRSWVSCECKGWQGGSYRNLTVKGSAVSTSSFEELENAVRYIDQIPHSFLVPSILVF